MDTTRVLEQQYLKAKIAYYEGDPIMSDSEFDVLEQHLLNLGSKAPEQVGSKRKDFDFEHPTKMLSLSKIQTEAREDGTTNYAIDEFDKWLQKNEAKVGNVPFLLSSPKFDGNAINITYQGTKLASVLTRGDGFTGKDCTERFLPHIDNEIVIDGLEVTEDDVIEIRAEVVIDVNIFNKKYKGTKEEGKYANARNYVAGVIGKDEYDHVKVSELTVMPLHYLINGKFVSHEYFMSNNSYWATFDVPFRPGDYKQIIQMWEERREELPYLLDGVVISFPVKHRATLGQNSHDPEWAVAIKFVPVETITGVNGIDWKVSKKGEIMPTLELDPVFLDGSTVKRASAYNAGYIVKNKLGPGAKVSIAKAGDIIPEVQKIIVPLESESAALRGLPKSCPSCKSMAIYDGTHLVCTNKNCPGKIAKQLTTALSVLDIKGIGEKTIEPFATDFANMYDIITYVLTCENDPSMENFGIKLGTRSHEIFVNAFKNIKSLTYEKVIQMLGYENVGRKISEQLALEHAGMEYDYAHLEKALVAKVRSEEVSDYIKYVVSGLEALGITIDRPKPPQSKEGLGVCMTGSPKTFGFATKAEFLSKFPHLYEVKLTDKDCKFLVTDDLGSTSNKMKTAEKKGIEIKTYNDF